MSSREPDLFAGAATGGLGPADERPAPGRIEAEGSGLAVAPGERRTPARKNEPRLPGPRVWSVGEVNRAARLLLEQSLPRMWVSGEVANFKRHRSDHRYFTLKDASAQLRCVLFRREAARLPMDPRDGTTVRVFGYLTLYEGGGAYQFVVSKLEAESEGGMWKLAFERLRKRLEAEGLTDPARKRPLPPFPLAVGVVTSPASAALRDIVAVVRRRAPWVRLVVSGATVQGEGAAREVASAVARLDETDVDVIVVARGGGSVEDLWAFNEELVARAVAASRAPVVSGVGHETDVTICDLVADMRAATPSAAAEAVVPERRAVERILDAYGLRLGRALASRTRFHRDRLERGEGALFRRFRRLAPTRRERLERGRAAMGSAVRRRIDRDGARLAGGSAAMDSAVRRRIEGDVARLARGSVAMEALSPLSTLARGYAVPLDRDGRLLRGTRDFAPELAFRLRVVDGNVPCTVTERPVGDGASGGEGDAR